MAYGRANAPWLYLQAFRLCVTLGALLHHEKDFSFFRARTIAYDGDMWSAPFLTLIIPHYLGCSPELQRLCQSSDRACLDDLGLSPAGLVPYANRIWRRDLVMMGPPTQIQAAMVSRLEKSWE